MSTWIVILVIAAGTYAFRSVAFALVGTRGLPGWTDRPLALVAPAAISALVATMVFTDHGVPMVPGLPETVALAATFVVVSRTGNVAAGMVCGFPVLWVLSAVGL